MGHEWMLAVLTDLETYATQNGLASLAEQLRDTSTVARADITAAQEVSIEPGSIATTIVERSRRIS